jgi:hypothetical protein
MEYVIRILEKELVLVKKALENWPVGRYPEQNKVRQQRTYELESAIKVLQQIK